MEHGTSQSLAREGVGLEDQSVAARLDAGGRQGFTASDGEGTAWAEEEAGARLLGSHCITWVSGPRILQEREKAFWV